MVAGKLKLRPVTQGRTFSGVVKALVNSNNNATTNNYNYKNCSVQKACVEYLSQLPCMKLKPKYTVYRSRWAKIKAVEIENLVV